MKKKEKKLDHKQLKPTYNQLLQENKKLKADYNHILHLGTKLYVCYCFMLNAFRLASAELYSRTVVLTTQENLFEFQKHLIRKANEK